MIESKFKTGTLTGIIISLVMLVILIVGLIIFIVKSNDNILMFVIALIPFLVILIWLTWGEIRTKGIRVTIGPEKLTRSNFFGMGTVRTFGNAEIDGYKISVSPSEYQDYEYLYLMTGNRKTIKISEFYHSNYFELKKEISKRFKKLGEEKFSFIREFKEAFH
ncbi:MAG: hypothetical protein WKI04_12115 [Ferruginibacter sp.]